MNKKEFIFLSSIFVCLFFVIGSIQVGSMQTQHTDVSLSKLNTFTFTFSRPSIIEKSGIVTIQINESTDYRNTPGEPLLPVLTKIFEFPFGTRITNIKCSSNEIYYTELVSKISPAASPVTEQTHKQITCEDPDIYKMNQFFPETWYSSKLSGGLNSDNILTTFLTIQLSPIRYNPVENRIQSLSSLTFEITYEPPSHPFVSIADAYDMIIISYDRYASLLDPLVVHKNSHGIRTQLVMLSDITDGTYFPVTGRDTQEKIKYFIKNAKETWNITYVLLVGNYVQVPIRYSSLETDKGSKYEELRFASDLYYADLYTANGSFCSWDDDNDGIYAEWSDSQQQTDIVDLVADVYVGRLACMMKSEVTTLVDKIITYENTTAGKDWFKRMVVAGGDTYEKDIEGGTDYNEGEVVTGKALEIMTQFIPVKIWMSLHNLSKTNIHEQISQGCGFLFFAGHGSPVSWATHNNGDYQNWSENYITKDMVKLTNRDMYPILYVGGCHNSEIDVTPLNIIKGFLKEGFHYFSVAPGNYGKFWSYTWIPECWSWVFVKADGGAIASLGSCGYGCDNVGDEDHDGIPDCTEYYDGWLELEFFRLYNQHNMSILGQTYYQSVTGYTQMFPVDTNRYDAKVIQTHLLFGDPSLKIGGYQ